MMIDNMRFVPTIEKSYTTRNNMIELRNVTNYAKEVAFTIPLRWCKLVLGDQIWQFDFDFQI